jgi:hypothetical protein
LKEKQKLGVTFDSDKLGSIDFTNLSNFSKLTMCSAGSLNFEMSFWSHHFDQNSNENILRISALKFFVASWGLRNYSNK